MAVVSIKRPLPETEWISDRRLYLDRAGNVVEHNDPNKVTLLVAKGGSLPMSVAKQHGLVAEAKKVEPKPEPKAESKVESKASRKSE